VHIVLFPSSSKLISRHSIHTLSYHHNHQALGVAGKSLTFCLSGTRDLSAKISESCFFGFSRAQTWVVVAFVMIVDYIVFAFDSLPRGGGRAGLWPSYFSFYLYPFCAGGPRAFLYIGTSLTKVA